MLKKILCIAAALCGFTGLAHGALTYTQTPALFLGGISYSDMMMGGISYPQVATNADGVTVVAWSALSLATPTSSMNVIFTQRYDANGNPLGSLVRIEPTGTQFNRPTVAIDSLGRYVVAWQKGQYPGSVQARLYDEQGKLTKEIELLTQVDVGWSSIIFWDLQMDANGNFVVVYVRNSDLFARRFNAQGARVGAEITVSSNTASDGNPTLAVTGNGAFAVAWQRARTTGCADSQYSKPGQCDDILLRRFDSQGAPLGAESKVADGNNNLDQIPDIAMDNQGNFVVAWERYRDLCQNMLQCDDILAQRYSAAGAKQGAAIAVIANNNQNDSLPQVARDGNGKFVVMWHRSSITSGSVVLSPADALFRAYDANGLSLSGTVSYRVASGLSTSPFDNLYPRVGISDTGKLNVLWGTDINTPSSYSYGNKVLVFRQMFPSAW